MHTYGGRLYAGTFNFTAGCEVWSYNGSSWRQEVGQDAAGTPGTGPGFGNLNNCAAYSMEVHDGKLYVGTIDLFIGMLPPFVGSSGGDIWAFDGAAWSQSADGGFGDIRNIGVMTLMEYGDALYAGTMCAEFTVDAASFPVVDLTISGKGCQLWGDGTGAWTKVAGDGFGDLDNAGVMSMEIYREKLFLGIFNGGITFTVDITSMDIQGFEWHSDGLSVCSYDGSAVSSVVQGGFPGIGGIGVFAMTTAEVEGEEMLLAGAARKIEDPGSEIDVNSLLMVYDGQSWGRAAEDGFGNPNNMINMSLAVWDGEAYIGTLNVEDGCEIWRGIASPPPPPAPAFYFAEGYTGAGFQEYLCLGNPGDDAPARSRSPTSSPTATTQEQDLHRPGRTPASPWTSTPRWGRTGRSPIKCEADTPSSPSGPCTSTTRGSMDGRARRRWAPPHPRTTWYFAEGYTGPGFDEWICVLNPGDAAADLTFYFQTQEAGEIVESGYYRPGPLPRHLQGQRRCWAATTRPRSSWSRPSRWWPSGPCTSTTRAPAAGTGPAATA